MILLMICSNIQHKAIKRSVATPISGSYLLSCDSLKDSI